MDRRVHGAGTRGKMRVSKKNRRARFEEKKAMNRLIRLMLLASSCFAQPTVKCGFELQGNVIFVKGSIGNAKALDLVLDSGSARTSFDEPLATSLNWDLRAR